MITRRTFVKKGGFAGLAAATMPLWSDSFSRNAFAQSATNSYKAVVLVTLMGGNDANNMIIPADPSPYAEYKSIRQSVALPLSQTIPLVAPSGSPAYAMHPSLVNVAQAYNAGSALVIANAGPIGSPATKAQLMANPNLVPACLLDHPGGRAQWESAQTVALPDSGWGGRIADFLGGQSGSLVPVLSAGLASIFTVGRSVQGVVIQANSGNIVALPLGFNAAIEAIAADDTKSVNEIVSQAAQLRLQSSADQDILLQAQSSGTPLKTVFPTSGFGSAMQMIARTINGRSVIGATRQIFYANQGSYDTHSGQLPAHAAQLSELDGGLGAFMSALQEMGLSDQVLVITHSDFNRSMQSNVNAGTDHAWGSHQLVLGGGIRGGRVVGTMPDLDLGGSADFGTVGIWIPTTSVTQVTAAIASWMGLTPTQIASVFPDLRNFGNQMVQLT